MTALSKKARIAGLLYLSLMILGPLSLIYIPNTLIVTGNASATAHNILTHETLFRLGIVCDLAGGTMLIFFALALYRLFEGVDHYQSVLVVILGGVMPAAIFFFNVLGDIAALILVRGPDYLSVFDQPQREALALLFLGMHDQEIYAAEVFWGLWLIPLAILVYRSHFLPRFLAVWLVLNGLAWLALSFTGLLAPHYAHTVHNVTSPARLGEIVMMLWLVVMGAREQPVTAPAA
jgi:hypothetical protein